MARFFALSFLLFWAIFASAQSNRYVDSMGVFHWQYHYSVMRDYNNPSCALVTFVFVNGEKYAAVNFRHECFNSQIQWLEMEDAFPTYEKKVQALTANLAPHQVIVWKFRSHTPENKDKTIQIEESAVLIMDENFQVLKQRLPAQLLK